MNISARNQLGGTISSMVTRRLAAVAVLFAALLAGLAPAAPALAAPRAPMVLAAASLQESLSAVADAWARHGHPRPVISFAASSALARQVEAGAPGRPVPVR